MILKYDVRANSAGEARSVAQNRAHAEGWTIITGTYVYPTSNIYEFTVEIYAGGQK